MLIRTGWLTDCVPCRDKLYGRCSSHEIGDKLHIARPLHLSPSSSRHIMQAPRCYVYLSAAAWLSRYASRGTIYHEHIRHTHTDRRREHVGGRKDHAASQFSASSRPADHADERPGLSLARALGEWASERPHNALLCMHA